MSLERNASRLGAESNFSRIARLKLRSMKQDKGESVTGGSSGGGVAGVATPPLNLQKKILVFRVAVVKDFPTRVALVSVIDLVVTSSKNARSCYLLCCCLNKAQLSQDCLAEAASTS